MGVHGPGAASLRPWLDAPVISMLDTLAAAVGGDCAGVNGVAEMRRTVELMETIRAAAARPVVEWL